MQLAAPVTITVNGTDTVLDQLNLVLIDDGAHKIVLARLSTCMRMLPLWRNAEYDAAGDWTQAQAEARIVELLGADPQSVLQALADNG